MKSMNYTPFVPKTDIEKHFAWISSYPHGSRNEKQLSDAIRNRALGAGLQVWQDALGNLLIKKPAAPGCEHKAPVVLQAHMDMVCTKVPGCGHNFETDPLKLVVDEEGWLHAEGTSLGADDGYGIAYMLGLLFGSANTPEIECMFTVQEEIGLIGACAFDTSNMRARRMISMDSGGESSVCVSSCGGRRITFSLPMQEVKAEGKAYRLTVGKLSGGHSAGVIHLSRANAIKMVAHTLTAMEKTGAVLISAEGGEADNAVPRDAEAVICVPEAHAEEAVKVFETMRDRFMKIHAASDPNMIMTLEETEASAETGYDMKGMHMLVALHDGVRAVDPARPLVLSLSSNLGILSTKDGKLSVTCMIRSINDEWRDVLSEQVMATGRVFGAEWVVDSEYPGMDYNPDSKLRKMFVDLMDELYGAKIAEDSSHGGLEIGYFSRSIPGLDILTLGCICEGCHSPSEKMNLASFNKMYGVLVQMLERME